MKRRISSVICSVLVIISTSAKAYEYCYEYKKQKDTTGYNACQSRNDAEIRDKISRENSDKRERDFQVQQLELQLQQLELLKKQQNSKSLSELSSLKDNVNSLKDNITGFEEALNANKCEVAKYLLDEMGKFKNSASVKLLESKGQDFKELLIANKIKYLMQCTDDLDKFESYLKEEVNNGSKIAQNILSQLEAKRPRSIPNLSDYGTDFQSLAAYEDAISTASIKLCEEAYKNKSGDGAYCLAKKAKNSEDAVRFYKEASNLGHPTAKNNLALLYDNLHIPELSPEIKKLMTSAAQSGIPHAQVSVGWWYMTGEHGFSKNYAEAMQWNLKAYKQGHSEGANNIGELYENGFGVPKNLEMAKSWYKKASVLGNKEATERLERLTK